MKEKLVVIIGPTAVGKTTTSIQLAKRFNGEIISGDSMQIYKSMDIGTAKVTKEEMEGIRHHLIDFKEPDESYTVAEFQQHAKQLISDINRRGKLPIIVGGTGLYIQSVLYDYNFSNEDQDVEYRQLLEREINQHGIERYYQKLVEIDPESAKKIHPNNERRVIRALEIFHKTGMTMTEFQANQTSESMYQHAVIGLVMERERLYERINQRVDQMIELGLIDEVHRLYNQGIHNSQSMQAIGYKELIDFFEGKISKDEAIDLIKRNSRRYAKRQLTWFRNKMDVSWYNMGQNPLEKIHAIFNYVAGKLQLKEK